MSTGPASTGPGENTLHLKCALVVKGAFDASLVPTFEASSGYKLEIDWAPTTVIMSKLAKGAAADAVLIVADSVDELIGQGKVEAGTKRVVLRSRIGVAVAAGAPHPDLSTLDAFKHAMTGARSVCYSRGGQSGVHFAPMLQRIGIADVVNAKATIIPAGFTAEKLITGEADIAIQQLSELAVVPGIEIVGPLPDAVQKVTTFAAAVMTGSAHRDMAERFVASLVTETAFAAYEASRLDPARD
ncbi:MAG: molybdate ABC transporter substrate-binding protein [Janthinobacterium lividum]